ncbi:MAG TPA: hypothetical protein VKB38_02815 [Terracidiphilus sp.]|nr:hypothetical protein [Terracidiphilus sp.]
MGHKRRDCRRLGFPHEWGNAEQASLTRLSDCMFDFRLSDDGQIELAGIGESTEEYIMEACYPELQKALSTAAGDDSDDSQRQIKKAVERERTRLWDDQPPTKSAATQLGRDIQKQLGAPSVVVDRIVQRVASKRLNSKEGEGKKPN